jgi:hypothetical protein
MEKSYNIYHNLGYWFLFLILLVLAGFYSSYFLVFFQPTPSIIHIHFTLMTLWIVMLIVQPFLIKYKKVAIHRMLGKISYVLVPLVLTSGFLMIRFSYYRVLDDLRQKAAVGLNQFDTEQLLRQAAAYEAIAFFWLVIFALFYCLAVINRRKSAIHARYIVATALALLGPTVDRIFIFSFKLEKLPGSITIEFAAFFIADMVLALLLWKDYTNNHPTKTLWTCLLIYLIGQVLYYTVPGTNGWTNLVSFIMKPVAQ